LHVAAAKSTYWRDPCLGMAAEYEGYMPKGEYKSSLKRLGRIGK